MKEPLRTVQVRKPQRIRVDFRATDLRRLILQKGMTMLWEQAARCPCEEKHTAGGAVGSAGHFQTNCPACFGRGVIYHSPLEITGIFEDATSNPKRFEVYGEQAPGMAGLTTLPEHTVNFLDRLLLTNNRMTYSETKIRRKKLERLRWPIVPRDIRIGYEYDPAIPVVETYKTMYVRKADDTGAIVPGELLEGIDFDITDSGEIDWTRGDARGTAPISGQRYSMQYQGRPSYIVTDIPYSFRDTTVKLKNPAPVFTELPRRAICKLEYLGRPEWPQGIVGENG